MATDRGDSPDEDIRLLGRVLGDVIAEQAGLQVFETVERVRKLAVEVRRGDDSDDARVGAAMSGLDIPTTLHVIRAFSWFSLLYQRHETIGQPCYSVDHQRSGHRPAQQWLGSRSALSGSSRGG